MKFYYEGMKSGNFVDGFIDASSEEDATLDLIDSGVVVEKISIPSSFSVYKSKFDDLNQRFIKIKLEDLIVFTRQFTTLFSAGIPVILVLKRLSSQAVNPKLKECLNDIVRDVEAGAPLSIAFGKHKTVFSPLYVNMLNVGEEGGVLDIVLDRLASILETDLDTKNRINTATRYPKMVVSAIFIAFGILITFVIPKFTSLFSKFGADLPLPTKILIGIHHIGSNYWWVLLILVVCGIIGFRKYKKTDIGKYNIDKVLFKLPIIGKLVHKIYISRISRILGLLYKSGIPIMKSFDIVSEVSGNEVMKDEVLDISDRVAQGMNIANSFGRSAYFPIVVSDMIAAGEETGQLDDMLFKIADYYDEEVDYGIKTLSSAIEPILLLFIAGMVTLLALGVFLPMWDMIKVFK